MILIRGNIIHRDHVCNSFVSTIAFKYHLSRIKEPAIPVKANGRLQSVNDGDLVVGILRWSVDLEAGIFEISIAFLFTGKDNIQRVTEVYAL